MIQRFFPILPVCFLLASGCASAPEVDTMLHEAPKGSIYLERIPDHSFKAAHPITLEEGVIVRTLRGVKVTEASTAIDTAFSKKPTPVQAFSEEDITFLAPFLTAALRQAAPDQQVGFQVRRYPPDLSYSRRGGAGIGSSEPLLADSSLLETTSGHLLAHDRSLYLTVSQYRKRAERADTINMANRRLPDPSGQADQELRFEPQEALVKNGKKSSVILGNSPEAFFAIDYVRLAELPAMGETPSSATETRASAPAGESKVKDQDLQQIRDEMKRKDAEIDTLKKEVEDIRRDLGKPSPKAP
jgi:hypothetical protein